MKNIYIRICGGLGNQFFQLGGSLFIADLVGEARIYLYLGAMNAYQRKAKFDVDKLVDFGRLGHIKKVYKNPLLRVRIPKVLHYNGLFCSFIDDTQFSRAIMYLPQDLRRYIFLDGYFQENITQEIFDFEVQTIRSALYEKDELYHSGCVIHIRGGDFRTLGWTAVSSPEYYLRAINIMIDKHKISDFFYVTDDMIYAESIVETLKKESIRLTPLTGDTISDFRTIGSFEYRILSSSTFALWASALGCEAREVIAPELWSPGKKRKIYLKNETRIY